MTDKKEKIKEAVDKMLGDPEYYTWLAKLQAIMKIWDDMNPNIKDDDEYNNGC